MHPDPYNPDPQGPDGEPLSLMRQVAARAYGDLPDPLTKPYLRGSEVAVLFCAAPKTVATWAKQGKLPYQFTLGRQRRYPTALILELVIARRRTLVLKPATTADHPTDQRHP